MSDDLDRVGLLAVMAEPVSVRVEHAGAWYRTHRSPHTPWQAIG